MSWFSSSKQEPASAGSSSVTNFFPITSLVAASGATGAPSNYGKLAAKDTAWSCATNKGFCSETQTWYSVLEDGSILLIQVIWSYIGVFMVPATTEFVFKLHNPKTGKTIFKTITGSSFSVNSVDGRSCKATEFSINHSGTEAAEDTESYVIAGSLGTEVQLSVTFTRPKGMGGFKYGDSDQGGFSYFGKDKKDGFAVHRFHPFAISSGSIVTDGRVIDAKGDAMYVHAIQGMRPNLVASRWNFAFFTTGGGREKSKLGDVRAVQMEFETTDDYGPNGAKSGRVKTNIGAIYSSALPTVPILVVGQTHPDTAGVWPMSGKSADISRATHTGTWHDKDSGYEAPTGLRFEWEGESRHNASTASEKGGRIRAEVEIEVGKENGKDGLIEKVDFLAAVPYILRKALSSLTGTKPFIFQYHKSCSLSVVLPGEEVPVQVPGWLFSEASFISS